MTAGSLGLPRDIRPWAVAALWDTMHPSAVKCVPLPPLRELLSRPMDAATAQPSTTLLVTLVLVALTSGSSSCYKNQ